MGEIEGALLGNYTGVLSRYITVTCCYTITGEYDNYLQILRENYTHITLEDYNDDEGDH